LKNLSLTFAGIILLCCGGWAPVFAYGDCLLYDWDTVTGGSQITPIIDLTGECGYEIDIENGPQPALLQTNILQYFEDLETHEILFYFQGTLLDQFEAGDFRIMALIDSNVADPIFAVDLSWERGLNRNKILTLKSTLKSELFHPSETRLPMPSQAAPIELADAFEGWIKVKVRFIQSSGPGINDGIIELLVEDILVDTWSGLYLDWPNANTPTAVSYGVVDIFDSRTSGTLRIIPLNPSPDSIDF